MEKKVVLGIILGDHAGSSPEMAAKTVLANEGAYIPVLTGNLERFRISCQHVARADQLDIRPLNGRPSEGGANVVYFCDVPAGPDIHFSTVTEDSGRLQYDSPNFLLFNIFSNIVLHTARNFAVFLAEILYRTAASEFYSKHQRRCIWNLQGPSHLGYCPVLSQIIAIDGRMYCKKIK